MSVESPKRQWTNPFEGWSFWHFLLDAAVTWVITLVTGWALSMPIGIQLQLAAGLFLVLLAATALYQNYRATQHERRADASERVRLVRAELVALIAGAPTDPTTQAGLVQWGAQATIVVTTILGPFAGREFTATIANLDHPGANRAADLAMGMAYLRARLAKLHEAEIV
jgi:hypothetical protein